ncbi:hypothetical protein KCG44_14180 [Pacificimonas sp. WHA3]|uniref:Uncharacterized protein n=1 Tax=Pacificimonas pallii TaxID=2827236 RepID=A0ABS6SHM4_9SPHN|nr:hypothetical protein [Pacificimonas pallii]MBV7257930.1 hypothetical protein [Pacificimonas pallii]
MASNTYRARKRVTDNMAGRPALMLAAFMKRGSMRLTSRRDQQQRDETERRLDDALCASFPASDPLALTPRY